jgi:hypothetical protein
MFISLPEYEFHMPDCFGEPGSRHWRVVEISLHAPWFVLTVEHLDPKDNDVRMSSTLCIAWDTDLADAIKAIGASRVLGLTAMMPAWSSATGQWSSRPITEVWVNTDETGNFVTLKDAAGEIVDVGTRGIWPKTSVTSELLLRLPPCESSKSSQPIAPACLQLQTLQ